MPVLELEEFPVPKPVRPVGAGGKLGRVHLTDQPEPSVTGDVVLLCGNVGPVEAVELSLEEIDELPVHDKCRRCASAMNGRARIKRFT